MKDRYELVSWTGLVKVGAVILFFLALARCTTYYSVPLSERNMCRDLAQSPQEYADCLISVICVSRPYDPRCTSSQE